MTTKEDDELECNVQDGLYDPDNEECQECYWRARRICTIFAMNMGDIRPADILDEEVIRKNLRRKNRNV